jgi:hypothetical protein
MLYQSVLVNKNKVSNHSAVASLSLLWLSSRFMGGKKKAKNPNAVALGRLGGLKGGKARISQLTAAERSELARKAVQARWAKAKGKTPKKAD